MPTPRRISLKQKIYCCMLAVCIIALFSMSIVGDETTDENWSRFEIMQCEDASLIDIPPIAIFNNEESGDIVVLVTWDTGCDIFINGECCSDTIRTTDEWGRPVFYGISGSTEMECRWMFDCDGEGGRMEEVQLGKASMIATRTIFENDSTVATLSRKCQCNNQPNIYLCPAIRCDRMRGCLGTTDINDKCVWVTVTVIVP